MCSSDLASLDRPISLDADDAGLPAVLKILAEKGDLNIVTGPGVSAGKITIHLKDVPVEQAVNLVVRAAGLAYERIGNSILVADARSLRDETGLSSYTIALQYADANDVAAALKGLSDNIQVDRGGNRLIDESVPLPAEHEVHGGEVDEGDGGGARLVARKQQASEWRTVDEHLAPSRRGRGGG